MSIFYSPISDFYIVCELQVERGFFDVFWSRGWKCIKLAGTSRRSNVMRSQHRDFGSTNIEVNKRQHRDVSTSRRQRDLCLSIIKSKKGTRIGGIVERKNESTEIRTTAT